MLRRLAALTTATVVSSGCYVHRAIVDPSPASKWLAWKRACCRLGPPQLRWVGPSPGGCW
jgi:hypothetical protein